MAARLLPAYIVNDTSAVRITLETATPTSNSMRVNARHELGCSLPNIILQSVSGYVSAHGAGPVGAANRSPIEADRYLPHVIGVTGPDRAGRDDDSPGIEKTGVGAAHCIIGHSKLIGRNEAGVGDLGPCVEPDGF